jgi:hypothetical protein
LTALDALIETKVLNWTTVALEPTPLMFVIGSWLNQYSSGFPW